MLMALMALQEHNFHQNRLPLFGSNFSGVVDGEHITGEVVAVDHLGWDSFVTIEKADGSWITYRGEENH